MPHNRAAARVRSALVLACPGHQREDERGTQGDHDGGELSKINVHASSVAGNT
jgi:hypothetical protein